MRVAPPPGIRTDLPALGAEAFWLHAINVRFRLGMAETIGPIAKVKNPNGSDLVINVDPDGAVDVFEDGQITVFGVGTTVNIIDWLAGTLEVIDLPLLSTTGRLWFDTTEKILIVGRSGLDGRVYAIDRATYAAAVIDNSPDGAICGGIVNGVLVFGGTESFDTNEPKMTVRWSARRTDPAAGGGEVGFEDWTPTDINASGEVLLEGGSTIMGGGPTDKGFVVWSDKRMHLLTPRTDTYTFTEAPIASRGLLATKTWTEADGRVWFFDQTRTLNVFDGGAPRQIMNPMSMATVERIPEDQLWRCSMSPRLRFGEVILSYPDEGGLMRELVYNYLENAWYPWKLNRLALDDRAGARPSLGVDYDGNVYAHDLPAPLPSGYPGGLNGVAVPSLAIPSVLNAGPGFFVSDVYEPFEFLIMTNMITGGDVVTTSLRAMNAVVNHVYGVPEAWTGDDEFNVSVIGHGDLGMNEMRMVDTQTLEVGDMRTTFRVGGKTLQVAVWAEVFRSLLRLGEISFLSEEGGRR